jgi:hypothetical protein
MSMDCFAAHLYGFWIVGDIPLRPELKKFAGINNLFDLVWYGQVDTLPGQPESMEDIDFIAGPEEEQAVYIGYSAVMPFEKPTYTKEQMDENLHNLAIYLFGPEQAENMKPEEIFDTWAE